MWLPEIVFVYLRINKNGESQKIKVMKKQELFSDYLDSVITMLEECGIEDIDGVRKCKSFSNLMVPMVYYHEIWTKEEAMEMFESFGKDLATAK